MLNFDGLMAFQRYTLDYNFEMPFQGLFSSNHADIARSYYPQVLDYARINGGSEAKKYNCTAVGGVEGLPGAVHFPVQLAPGGLSNYPNALGTESIVRNNLLTILLGRSLCLEREPFTHCWGLNCLATYR